MIIYIVSIIRQLIIRLRQYIQMQILSKESQGVYLQLERQCGFTSNKDEIKNIFTLHVYKLERNQKYLQKQNIKQQEVINNLECQLKMTQEKNIKQLYLIRNLELQLKLERERNFQQQQSINKLRQQLRLLQEKYSSQQQSISNLESLKIWFTKSSKKQENHLLIPHHNDCLSSQFFDIQISTNSTILNESSETNFQMVHHQAIHTFNFAKFISVYYNTILHQYQKDYKYANEMIHLSTQSQSRMEKIMSGDFTQLIQQKIKFSIELDGIIEDKVTMHQQQIKKYWKITQIRKSQKLILNYISQLKKQLLCDTVYINDNDLIRQINQYYKSCLEKVQLEDDGAKKSIEQYCQSIKIQNIHQFQQFHVDKLKYNHLKQLNISNCMINDSHIDIFNKYSLLSLIKLDISGNNITNNFIICISELLRQLIDLNACFTDITDISVRVICKSMRRGKVLDLSYTKVTERCVEYLNKMKDLQKLSIWSGQEYPDYYEQYLQEKYQSNLEKYKQHRIKLNEKNIVALSQLKLHELIVNLQKQNGDTLLISNKEQIKHLHVNSKISTKLIKQILNLNNISNVQLNIRQIKIAKTILKEGQNKKLSIQNIQKYKKVDQVILNEFRIGTEIAFLEVEPIIKELQMPHSNLHKQSLLEITEKVPYLTKLNLYDNNIDDEGAISISRNLKYLTSLNLSWNNIKDQGVIQIAKNLKNLKNLNLSYNNITKEGAYQIAHNLMSLTSLDLRNNNIKNEGVIQIAIHLKSLINLKLWNNNIDDEASFYIAQNLKGLIYLDLRNNSISNKGAIQIITNLKHLTYLDLKCNNIQQIQKSKIVALSKSKILLLI